MPSLRYCTGADVLYLRDALQKLPSRAPRACCRFWSADPGPAGFDFRFLSDDADVESLGDLHLDDWIKGA